ncbi:MAG TPA: NusG domain II-containing protein [Fastidiosipila sp.]|nr:NusG domain II-containing protein [Fastidiosipila sp.]
MPESPAKKRPFYRRADVLILAVIVLIAVVWLLLLQKSVPPSEMVAVVYIDQVEVARIDLLPEHEQDFVFPERPAVRLHRDASGAIQFVESDCPDKVCINTGKLHLPYQDAACLPNMMVVSIKSRDKLESADADDVDLAR